VKRGTREADLAVEAGRDGRRISPDLGVVGSGFCGGGGGAARAAGEGASRSVETDEAERGREGDRDDTGGSRQ